MPRFNPLPSRMRRWLRAALGIGVALWATGCVRYDVMFYEPLTWDLDGRNELHLSSYPSWFPRESAHVPFL